MAARAKPTGGKGKGAKKEGTNTPTQEEIQEHLDKVHETTDEMEEANAAARGEIGRHWDKASTALNMTKAALKLIYSKQRRDRKDAAKAAKMDTRDRDGLLVAAGAWGEDNPMGAYLADLAKRAGQDQDA